MRRLWKPINLVPKESLEERGIDSRIHRLCAEYTKQKVGGRSYYLANIKMPKGETQTAFVILSTLGKTIPRDRVPLYFSHTGELELGDFDVFDSANNVYGVNGIRQYRIREEGESPLVIFLVEIKGYKSHRLIGLM